MIPYSKMKCLEIVKQLTEKKTIFDPSGDVAQLARALGWQPRGRGFESHLLHTEKFCESGIFFV